MKPDAALADRRQSVRDAGREWLRAGWIHENAFQRIVAMYPDDRVRVGVVFRILFFVLTLAAILGVIFASYSFINSEKPIAVLALIAGLACWMTADHLIVSKKRVQGGIEAAFSLAAIWASLSLSSSWIRLRSATSLSGRSPPLPEGRLASFSSRQASRPRKVAFSAMRWDFVLVGICTPPPKRR